MNSILYLVRHGQAATPGILAGQSDLPLLSEGEAEVRRLRDSLAGTIFTRAWSSPLTRAKQTAALLLEGNAANTREIEEIPGLREIRLGEWEGKSTDWVRQHYPQKWQARGNDFANTAPPGGESFAALAERVRPAFAAICAEARAHAASLLVAHQAVNRVILADILGLPLSRLTDIPQPPAALTLLRLDEAGRCVLWGKERTPF